MQSKQLVNKYLQIAIRRWEQNLDCNYKYMHANMQLVNKFRDIMI